MLILENLSRNFLSGLKWSVAIDLFKVYSLLNICALAATLLGSISKAFGIGREAEKGENV